MSILALEVGQHADARRVERMLATSTGVGAWDADDRHHEPGIAIGVRSRWVVPEDEGARAIAEDRDRGVVVAWEGRIDDRIGLIRALGASPRLTNAELACAAFAKWGADAPKHLIGEFVFTVFDRRERRALIVRDRLGIRPVYYVVRPDGLVRISSCERGLFACGDVDERPNLKVLASALAGSAVLLNETLREGVHVLEPGSILVVREGGTSTTTYFSVEPGGVDERLAPAEHVERIRAALDVAVASRTRGKWPIAAHASGGLDSSSVIAVAAKQLREANRPAPLLLHMTCASLPCDERRYARSVAARVDAPMVERDGSSAVYGPSTTDEVDLGGPWFEVLRELYGQAREAGARVVLTGDGSDEVQLRHWLEIDDSLLRGEWLDAARFAGLFDEPLDRDGWSRLARGFARNKLPQVTKLWRARRRPGDGLPSFLTPMARASALESLAALEQRRNDVPHPSPLRRAVAVELTSTVGMTLIMQELHSFASHCGVELLHPFLDIRVVEAFHALPTRMRTSFDLVKPTLRTAMEGLLPPEVLWRSIPTHYNDFHEAAWRRERDAWLPLARSSSLARLGLVDPERFRRAVEEAFEGELTADVRNALELEGWLARLDATSRAPHATARSWPDGKGLAP
ncbi:MAG: hypothetical protein HOW73_13620 [Polyangiaceae bacterium]|nr:hypothetical protein [Polyangiaceae bacterium]